MANIFTLKDFKELFKKPDFKRAWDRYISLEEIIALQSPELQKEINDRCMELIKGKYGKEEIKQTK